MRAILFDHPGEADVLYLGEVPAPTCSDDEVCIAVGATAVNRADLLQRRGLYPPPPGASPILGLEAAGCVVALGAAAQTAGFAIGQRVMALLAGGGYAEQVAVPYGQVMPIPPGLSDEQAAAIPEAFLTAYLNLFILGGLPPPGTPCRGRTATALIHGGASGVGTAALQLCRAAGIVALCTVGDDERAARCQRLGAHGAINYHHSDFVSAALHSTEQRGVNLILDNIGASYLVRNLRALAQDGRLVSIGLMGGSHAELDMALLLQKRIQLIGSTLRTLPVARKAALVKAFTVSALPLFTATPDVRLEPVIERVLPLAQAAEAHRAMDQPHVGKIVLQVAASSREIA